MYEVGHGKPPASYNYKPGQPPSNPGGFPQSRRKLTKRFCDAFHKDFDAHGDAAIVRLREEHVDKYCQMIIDMMPTEMKVNGTTQTTASAIAEGLSAFFDRITETAARPASPIIEGVVSERPLLSPPVHSQAE